MINMRNRKKEKERERERERKREREEREGGRERERERCPLIFTVINFVITNFLSSLFQMYRITVRTSNEAVSRKICDILSEQF